MSDQRSQDEKDTSDNIGKRLDALENKVNKMSNSVEESLKLLHEIEAKVNAPTMEGRIQDAGKLDQDIQEEMKKDDESYKKVLKIIDIIAIVIIIFIIIDGLFNGFTLMTAISNFVGQLF